MTRRERMENQVDRRLDWADGRDDKSDALLKQNEPYRGDIAFNTQPGHIPERARVIRRSEQAYEHRKMADHHRLKASGIQDQLNRSVFDDDTDAIQRLEDRIAEREAERSAIKSLGAKLRAAARAKPATREDAIQELKRRGVDLRLFREHAAPVDDDGLVFRVPSWVLSNLGATIRRDRKRLERLLQESANG